METTTTTTNSKTWTKEEIWQNIITSNAWVEKSLVALLAQQTADERASETTMYQNGRGFSGCDAQFLTSLAEQANARRAKLGYALSEKQYAAARKCLKKYCGQLARIANKEI